ncbi:MAG TPA: biotin carboxylase N-terminal domain-containing protein [Egibacteraceae bacterium]|nr:biotin carboxylase N-terminal domain-containing protein [Egibacteraceae bacterium]
MFDAILIANRGEIARRVMRTARALAVRTVAVYSDADAGALHVREADEAVRIGPPPPQESYLDGDAIIAAARATGAQAIHPGYGFLSESPEFADAVHKAGLVWIGPPSDAIAAVGEKVQARNLMAAAGVPVARGTSAPVGSVEQALDAAEEIGYPVMVKAAAGGGGIGMRVARDPGELRKAFETTSGQAERFFSSSAVLLEQYLPGARHVEVQIFGLADGRIIALGERDCSVQRRYQKVFEETPSPGVDDSLRERMLDAAVRAGERIGYRSAGTVECLVADGEFVFLEVNARLQVEHPVTELVTGIDLVAEQLRVAAGEPPGFDPDAVRGSGHAVELRIYAEDPVRFLPSPGRITAWRPPSGEGIRLDAGYAEGDEVTPFYDPLLAKLCAWGPERATALDRAAQAAETFVIDGPKTNLAFHRELLADPGLRSGDYDTGIIERMRG